jgi:hypothetical protein
VKLCTPPPLSAWPKKIRSPRETPTFNSLTSVLLNVERSVNERCGRLATVWPKFGAPGKR